MPWDWPVEVNNVESQAFCVFLSLKSGKSIRLISEFEYFLIASRRVKEMPNSNMELRYFSGSPVDLFEHEGVFDVFGNVQ